MGRKPSAAFATLLLLALIVGLAASLVPQRQAGAAGAMTFAAIGDYGTGNSNETAVANLVKSWNPDFVIALGDDYYNSAGGSGSTKYDIAAGKDYCQFLAGITTTGTYCREPGPSATNRFFPSLGNHDYSDAGTTNNLPTTYTDYFSLPGAGVTSPNPTGNERYYDYVQGPVHFFVINSDNGSGQEPDGTSSTSKQATWLKNALAASTSTWNVVYFHHPPYSSGTTHGSSTFMRWPFAQWGADAVLSGHEHNYERLFEDGIVYFVNGIGGASRYGFGTPIAGSQFRYSSNFGAQRVTASDTSLTFDFVSIDGVLRDSYTLSKGSTSPTATSQVTNTPLPTATRAPTNTPLPTATPGGASYQPTAPIRAAFFYPWFPNAWNQGGVFPFTNYTPSMGYYSSTADSIIDEQLNLAARAHLDAFISSWWGQGHHTDTALQYILGRASRAGAPNPNMRFAIYYENESLGDPSVSQIVSDMTYLQTRAFASPSYLRVNGKPVVFVYADATDAAGMAQRWADAKAQLGGNLYVVLKVYAGYRSDPNQPDSWHQYSPAVGYDVQDKYSAVVSPGFWLKGQAERLPRDAARFENDVKSMVASGAMWQLVTTWSEWGEGTIVEPSAEFGYQYIDILCRNLPGTTPCDSGAAPTPANTAIPVATNTPPPASTSTPTPIPTGTTSNVYAFAPQADAYVRVDQPSISFGNAATLETDDSPQKHILMRFDVSGLGSASVVSAKLRLYCIDPSGFGGDFRRVASNDWNESSVTWDTAPVADATSLATLGSVSAGSWYEVDLSSLVKGEGTYSLAVVSNSSDGADYTSREGGTNSPQLVVTTAGQAATTPTAMPTNTPLPPTSTATPVPPTATPTYTPTQTPTNTPTTPSVAPGSLTVYASADAYVDSSKKTTNYGTSTQMRTDNSPTVRSYVDFDVRGVSGTVTRATLWVYANSGSRNGVDVRPLANSSASWSETAIDYANAPAIASSVASSSGPVAAGTWVALDVTSLVRGNGLQQFALTTPGSTAISLVSRHAQADVPYLTVEYR